MNVTGSTFEGNRLRGGGEGLAIFVSSSVTATITSSSFLRNTGQAESSGTLFGVGAALINVSHSLFVGNSAEDGSTIWTTGDGTFINNTVYGNKDRTRTLGTITMEGGSSLEWLIANNVIYGNATANEDQYEVSFMTADGKTMAHNLIEGDRIKNGPMRTGAISSDNLSVYEVFASIDPTNANYLRLLTGSVGVDAGNNDYLDGDDDEFEAADVMGVTDLAGAARIANTTVDLGAYEGAVASNVNVFYVLDARGKLLESGSENYLSHYGVGLSLKVVYLGPDATGITIAPADDPTNSTNSTTASPAAVSFNLDANTGTGVRRFGYIITLTSVTPVQTQTINFVQGHASRAVYVAVDGDADAEGLTWETATTLDKALGEFASEGDAIYIKSGVYTPRDSVGVRAVNP